MHKLTLAAYHSLPPIARDVAAGARGVQLRRWRYGRETDLLVAEALGRESWDARRWAAWREERLAFVLHRAATRVPYYRDQWARRRANGDRASWAELSNWPLLEKQVLRERARAFVADDCDVRRMFPESTSGTTGTPLELWWTKRTVRAWYALFEARVRIWNGVSRRDRWAILGGQPVVPADAAGPPYWVWNSPMRQLYLSANHVSPANAPQFADALRRYRVTHLVGYPSSLYALCGALGEIPVLPDLRVVIANAEPLLPGQREPISSTFGCPVVETYGMGEIVAGGSECGEGRLHAWPEVGFLEVLADMSDRPLVSGSTGRLACTGLLNTDMPLIRYLLGDRASVASEGDTCSCGRNLPLLGTIEGRSADMIMAKDGRRVFWLNPVFQGSPVREAQIVQTSLDELRVRIVPAEGYSRSAGDAIVERLRGRVGDMDISIELVEAIGLGPNGKFRPVVSLVDGARAAERSSG